MKTRMSRNENGIALILVLGILVVLATLATTFAFNMRLEQKAARNYLDTVTTDCILRIGVEYAIALLRNDSNGYDAYTESWHTSFTGSDVDNDGDGVADSKWISVFDPEGNLISAYAVYVVDELSKININRAGNISSSGAHGANQGWTTAEITLQALTGIGTTLHENIVKYRYGTDGESGNSGTDDDNDRIPTATATLDDDIDNDADGSTIDVDEGDDEPDEYIPHAPFGDDVEFATIEQIKLVSGIGKGTFGNIKNLITVYSAYSCQDRYYDAGWQDRININAVRKSEDLYDMINSLSGYSEPDGQRYAANIIDYGDFDYVPTICQTSAAADIYGIEGLQINEVMCNVSGIPRAENAPYQKDVGFPGPSDIDGAVGNWKWPWDNGTYDITIDASTSGGANYAWILENGEVGQQSGNSSVPVPVNNVQISGDWINLRITDEVDPPPEQTTTFNKITIDAGDFVEIINISELDISVDSNWKIRGSSSGDHFLSSATLSNLDYLVVANSLYAIDYMYGNNDGVWDGDGSADMAGKAILCNPMDLTNAAGEDLALIDDNSDVIDVAPASVKWGTVDWTAGGITPDKSRIRVSPIDDTTDWINSTNAGEESYKCTPGTHNDTASPDSSWNVHDGPFASIGLIGDVPKGTGAGDTLDSTDIEYFADKLTFVAQRLEGEDASTNPWGASVGTGIDGTDLYEAPNNSDSWDWVWTDGTNVRLFDGDYHLFVCADYPTSGGVPKYDFQRPSETDREVRPNCLAYAGDVTVSGKSFKVTITGNDSDTPRLDYVLLVPKQDSPGRAGRININTAVYNSTANKGVLQGLTGITDAIETAIDSYRSGDDFLEIGDMLNVAGMDESIFASISNLITVRSDVFQIICTSRAVKDMGTIGTYEPEEGGGEDITLAEKKIEAIVDRSALVSGGAIKILLWKEMASSE